MSVNDFSNKLADLGYTYVMNDFIKKVANRNITTYQRDYQND